MMKFDRRTGLLHLLVWLFLVQSVAAIPMLTIQCSALGFPVGVVTTSSQTETIQHAVWTKHQGFSAKTSCVTCVQCPWCGWPAAIPTTPTINPTTPIYIPATRLIAHADSVILSTPRRPPKSSQ